jgi:hypothetical protein
MTCLYRKVTRFSLSVFTIDMAPRTSIAFEGSTFSHNLDINRERAIKINTWTIHQIHCREYESMKQIIRKETLIQAPRQTGLCTEVSAIDYRPHLAL